MDAEEKQPAAAEKTPQETKLDGIARDAARIEAIRKLGAQHNSPRDLVSHLIVCGATVEQAEAAMQQAAAGYCRLGSCEWGEESE